MVDIGPARYSGPSTDFWANAIVESQAGNHSHVRVTITCYNGPSGSTGSYFGGSGTHKAAMEGIAWVVEHYRGSNFLPSGVGQGGLRWQETGYIDIEHDANGYHGNVNLQMQVTYGSINDTFYAALGFPRIPKAPSKVPTPVYVSASTTTIEYTFTGPGDDGGSGITSYTHQVATDANFTQNLQTWTDNGSPGQATALTPGTTHYIRYRANNAIGSGPWSDNLSALTLPAVPPGLLITASPSGTSVTLTFTPPGGVTGVAKYDWERRTPPGATADLNGSTTTTVATVDNLTPGTTYEWRASAWIGTYQSPWTAWTPLTQPKPNTNPGDYFDGATTDTADLDYGWTGTVNLSTSQALGKVPTGWLSFANGNPTAGATGAIYQITDSATLAGGAKSGSHAVRAVFFSDQSTPGFSIGTDVATGTKAQVTEHAVYVGSIYVRTSKATRGNAVIGWMTSAGAAPFASTAGAQAQTVAGQWQRFIVTGPAPSTAAYAQVSWASASGVGYSAFQSGDTLDADAAMVSLTDTFPYFDGDTLDDANYNYDWTGAPNASPSTRKSTAVATAGTASVGPDSFSLIDPDCNTVPPPPRPPTVPSDCIDDVGIWRRYYVGIPSVNISDWLSVVPTLEIETGAFAARQVRVRYYPNPFEYAPDQINTNEWCAEQIISYMPALSVLTLDGVTQRSWAEVNGGSPQSADHLLYGTGGQPATWPILSCGISYLVSLEVPIDAPEGNIQSRAFVTTRS